MRKKENFIELLKSTRIERTIPSLLIILFASSLTNKFNTSLLILGACLIFAYSSFSIYNAIKDKDYQLPNYSEYILFLLLFIGIFLSFYNKIILFTVIAWISLGFIYNTLARKILLMDTTILSITHYTLPLFTSLILLGENYSFAIKDAFVFLIVFWFLTPIKNLKGSRKDKKRGYKTLALIKNGEILTLLLFAISFIFMSFCFFFFNLNYIFLSILPFILILYISIIILFYKKKSHKALALVRILIIIFILNLISSSSFFNLIRGFLQ